MSLLTAVRKALKRPRVVASFTTFPMGSRTDTPCQPVIVVRHAPQAPHTTTAFGVWDILSIRFTQDCPQMQRSAKLSEETFGQQAAITSSHSRSVAELCAANIHACFRNQAVCRKAIRVDTNSLTERPESIGCGD
eukprot:2125039-Amphidinium_carterae.1